LVFISGVIAAIDVIPVIKKDLRIQGNNAGPVAGLRAAAAAIAAHSLIAVVDEMFTTDEAISA